MMREGKDEGAKFSESLQVSMVKHGVLSNRKEEARKVIEVGKLLGMSFDNHEIGRRVMQLEDR